MGGVHNQGSISTSPWVALARAREEAAKQAERDAAREAAAEAARAAGARPDYGRASPLRPGEGPDEALSRRRRESAAVEERLVDVYDHDDLYNVLEDPANAGRLVALEVESDTVCDTGLDEASEAAWNAAAARATGSAHQGMAPCEAIRGGLARTARDCPNTVFLRLVGDATPASRALCEELGVHALPSLFFFKDSRVLQQISGHVGMGSSLGEGVMYYGGADGAESHLATDYVDDVALAPAGAPGGGAAGPLRVWAAARPAGRLGVAMVSTLSDAPCLRVYPAAVALARNLRGKADFARLVVDPDPAAGADPGARAASAEALAALGVDLCPTFLMFRDGVEVHRFVGSSRGDLLGEVLTLVPDAPDPRAGGGGEGGGAGSPGPGAPRKRSFRRRKADDPPPKPRRDPFA